MIFISTFITTIFIFLKVAGVIDWHWLIVIAPVILDVLTIATAKALGGTKHLELMLCHPLKIKSVMRSNMVKRTS